MTPKISIVIPTAGNDFLRSRNFAQCIRSIEDQNFKEYEVIIVEQSLDGNFYKEIFKSKGFRWIGIKDPEDRGFNLSWCRNVGAKLANGEKIILMDADMVFESEYLDKVYENKDPFAGGAYEYHWINNEIVTSEFCRSRNFEYVYKYGKGEPRDPVFRFNPFTRGCGYGAVLVYNKDWYWNEFGGYPEDFFKYGWEDKAAIEIVKEILGIKNDDSLPRIDYRIIHLSHYSKDTRNMKKNEELFNKIVSRNKFVISRDLKNLELGNIDSPRIYF
jgi:glycosyltransferase involved in cell wall biosynthesis